jgi:hypothetical protein
MARLDDAADGLKAISAHRESILDAYLNNFGALHATEENQSAIKALLKHHLAWQIEPDEPVQLSRALTTTLGAVTRNYRMTNANIIVGSLWQEIEESISGYKEARKRGAEEDSQTYLGNAFEYGHQLIEGLGDAIANFSHHISSGFTHIHNLELRALENRKMIDRATQFNNILATFDYEDLHTKAGTDPELRRLLLKAIPKALEQCRKELRYAIGRLTDMLHTINRQKRKSQLIDNVLSLYQNQDSYTPTIDNLDDLPVILNRAEKLMDTARADIRHPDQEELLAEIIQKLPQLGVCEDESYSPEPVKNALEVDSKLVPLDPIRSAALDALSLVKETGDNLSAKDVYLALEMDCESELWLMSLVNEVYGLPDTERKNLNLEFVEEQDDIYNGNFWVSDVIIQPLTGNRT